MRNAKHDIGDAKTM